MKLYILGTCSGTEPMPNRHHTAIAFEINGRVYWFDAGETCSHTAYLMGVDMMAVSDIFISHHHIDHTGGLPNLLWTVRKLSRKNKTNPKFGDITLHMPSKECFDAVVGMLKATTGNDTVNYGTVFHHIEEGIVLEDENIRVTAIRNHHIPDRNDGRLSYSFCIEAEGSKVIFSGDVKSLDDLAPFLDTGCDLLLMESGHHAPETICAALAGGNVKKLYFLHHGRAILEDYDSMLEKCRVHFPSVMLGNDGDILEL
ncbi:MAG: MBL fold metallo-hydrolase [Ruminococcaceae bacterium]|nr:MBL fold metallo-hydrolase [Oscillospiraceae bacterium]